MTLNDDFLAKLTYYCENGYVRKSAHPVWSLWIYNYTPKTTFEERWDEITLNTRGLIIGYDIIKHEFYTCIQGPKKFFNKEEKWSAKFDISHSIISEKLDGYYISIKLEPRLGLVISSRGSFCNKYTEAAEKLITEPIRRQIQPNIQYFCELLQDFPEDAGIIVTKHPIPRLVCWAMRDEDGKEIIPTKENCPFEVAQKMTFEESKKYLTNQVEGVVAYNPKTSERVKIKTEWFLETHRLISNCTPQRVWELCKNGDRVEDLDIPNEFMEQMLSWQTILNDLVESEYQKLLSLEDKYSSYTDKELGLSNLDLYTKGQIFNIRKDRISAVFDKIYLYKKDEFLEKC